MNHRARELRADQRRNEIVACAARAIREHGLRGAGMRQIAEAAGLSTGNLYYYFRNKQELIYYCQDRALDRLLQVADQAQENYESRSRLGTLIDGHLRVVLSGGESLHLELEELPRPLYKKLVAKRDRYEQKVRDLIAYGQKHQQLRAGDPKLMAFALLGALNWAARWYRADGEYALEAIIKSFTAQLVGGLVWLPTT